MFLNIIQIVSCSFNDPKWRRMVLLCNKKTISIIRRNNVKNHCDFYCLNCLHPFATEKNA